MNLLLRLICCFLVLGLTGCVTRPNTTINTQQCQKACAMHFETCNIKCDNDCPTCAAKAHLSAALHYGHYLNEKKIQGELVTRDLNSYRDPLQCRKVSCNCAADLNACYQSCTGVIKKQLRVVSKCDQGPCTIE